MRSACALLRNGDKVVSVMTTKVNGEIQLNL